MNSVQTGEPEFKSQYPYKSWVWWYTVIIPTPGKQKQEDIWVSMASLASLNGEVKVSKRPCLRRYMVFLRMTLNLFNGYFSSQAILSLQKFEV